jgi:Chemotaxis signal transduction protein
MDNSQLVIFKLGLEEYAMDISFAQEIIRIPPLTKIPNAPSFLEGVFNLRGKVLPVFDLKKRFKLDETERGIDSRLLIINLDGMMAGIIVDDVSEVMKINNLNNINNQSIANLDNEIVGLSKDSIQGVCLVEERIIILLNVPKLKSDILKLNFKGEEIL